jgi:Carboxypeptidase regulatory-like domain/TonB dependent receptor
MSFRRIAMPHRGSIRLPFLLLAVVCVVSSLPSWAQKDAGSIVGTVKDQTGAIVANAKVTVSDVERGIRLETTTNESGEYVAGPLRVGRYTVTVEHPGFKRSVTPPVDLDVQQRIALNIALQVGQISESIEVTAATPLLETETSELGQVVDNKRMANLPLNGRNFAQLALLTAGTAPSEPGARDEGGFGFSANGARSLQNNFLLDGVDNNSNLPDLLNETNYVIQPSVEAIEEFKVQTNAYSAEFGRGNGAIINATIKSGTNQFHGSAYEFLRNEKLDAKNFFDDPNSPIAPYKQNQFGFTIGGPIIRNRTFFFADYEGLRIRQAQTLTSFVPTAAQLSGDFSDQLDLTSPQQALAADQVTMIPALDCAGHPTYAGEIFNARQAQNSGIYASGLCGVPFGAYDASGNPTNIIPQGQLDPLSLAIARLYPAPNVNGNGFNFLSNPVRSETRNNFDVRIDQKFSDKDYAFFRFSYEDQPSLIPGPFDTTGGDGGGFFSGVEDNAYRSFATSWTHLFRSNLTNEFRLGYNRVNSQRQQINADKTSEELLNFPGGFPGIPNVPGNGGLPQLTFNDINQIGSPTFLPSHEVQNTYGLSENLTWVRGSHSFKFGTDIRSEEFTIFQPAAPRGTLDFGPGLTDNPATPFSGGSGFASFLVGLSDGGSINNLHNIDYHHKVYAFYAQDDWKVTPNLTVNLGLRYELFTTIKERNNELGTFDLSTGALIVPKGVTAQLTPQLAAIIPVQATGTPGLISPDTNNFAPRIGLAYKVSPKFVVRAGYGIFYGGDEAGPYSNPSMGFNPPFFVSKNFNQPCGAASANPATVDCSLPGIPTLSSGFPANSLTDPEPPPLLFSLDPKLVTPYMQQWHLSTQYELPSNTVFEVTYAGSRGLKQYIYLNGNQAEPNPDPNLPFAPRRPLPQIDGGIGWFRSAGFSNYNSLQTRVEKRFSRGLTFLASYTWAHALDIASNADLGAQNNGDFRDFRNPSQEYGNSDFDIRHRFVFSYLYELPIGHGKRMMGNASGALNQIVGGWQVGGITSVSTGNWFTITDDNGVANSDGNSQRPDLIGDPRGPHCEPNTFFNTCAFADPPSGSFGNVSRNSVQGPGYQIWDFSVFKNFPITERTKLEFRAEFFNVFNHPNLQFAKSGPQNSINTTTFGTPQFGFLTGARDPRQIQLALKLSF